VTARATTVRSLGSGTWYFAVRAVNSSSGESGNSNVGQKVVSSGNASASRNVAITINPATQTLRVYNATVYDVSRTSAGPYALGRVVGTVAVGRSCQAGYSVPGTDYYRVWREEVTFSRTSRSNVVMARCRRS
jgi:hypothetical protein